MVLLLCAGGRKVGRCFRGRFGGTRSRRRRRGGTFQPRHFGVRRCGRQTMLLLWLLLLLAAGSQGTLRLRRLTIGYVGELIGGG